MLTKWQCYDIYFSLKKNAEVRARHEEMLGKMHLERENDNPRKDSLPQESSTPKNDEKEKGKIEC